MMFKRHPGLGLIPEWQFSSDAVVNPHINPHVQYPEGMTQQTIQPIGTHWGQGLGCPPGVGCVPLRGLGIDNPFDSWWWTNRKPLVIGSVAVVGLALLAGLAAALK